MVTIIIKTSTDIILHEWNVSRWAQMLPEEREHVLEEIVTFSGWADNTQSRIWIGLRILDLLGVEAKAENVAKVSMTLLTQLPDPGIETCRTTTTGNRSSGSSTPGVTVKEYLQ